MVFAPYADLIWLETKAPNLEQARSFARKIREKYPGKWFVYNLSPSFNWASHGFSGKFTTATIFYLKLTPCCPWDRYGPQKFRLGACQGRVTNSRALLSLPVADSILEGLYCS
jgi:isocitrate lyase